MLLRPGKGDVQHEACFRDSGAAAGAACGYVTSRPSKLLQQWHSDLLSYSRLCTGHAARCSSLGVHHSSCFVLVWVAARVLRSYSSMKASEAWMPPANLHDIYPVFQDAFWQMTRPAFNINPVLMDSTLIKP